MFDKNLTVLCKIGIRIKWNWGICVAKTKFENSLVEMKMEGARWVGGWLGERKVVAEEEEEERAGRISVTAWLESWLRVATKNTHF